MGLNYFKHGSAIPYRLMKKPSEEAFAAVGVEMIGDLAG